MKTYYRYLYKELLLVSLLTTGVLTFFLIILNFLRGQIAELLLSRDVSVVSILELMALLVPFVLTFTLPWGLLMGVLLVFGRLSQDNELLTLKSSGLGLGIIIAPAIILSLIFCGISFWINASLGPQSRILSQAVVSNALRSNPLVFLTANQVIDKFAGYRIFIGDRHGNEIENVHIWQVDSQDRPIRAIRAQSAVVTPDLESQPPRLLLKLINARQEERPTDHPEDITRVRAGARFGELPVEIPLTPLIQDAHSRKSVVNETLSEMGADIFRPSAMLQNLNVTPILTEIQKRIAWSLSGFTFVLVGIPLALQTQRRETSVGVALSLGIVLVYYAIFIVAESMKQQARFFPELIIWLPNLIFQTLGFFLLMRANKKG